MIGFILKCIGAVAILMWIAGAIIPGFHCHIVLGGDDFAIRAHQYLLEKTQRGKESRERERIRL